jgi:hypothetical protein
MSTFFSVPLCIVCHAVNLNLTWTYYFTGILISRQNKISAGVVKKSLVYSIVVPTI